MNIEPYLYQMERNGLALTWLVRDMPDELAKWRPDQDSWSVVEVMYHLIDEEREDLRQRLNYLLNMPGEQFPPIDPQNWPEERKYNERDLLTAIKTFINERAKSINWLSCKHIGGCHWTHHRMFSCVFPIGGLQIS